MFTWWLNVPRHPCRSAQGSRPGTRRPFPRFPAEPASSRTTQSSTNALMFSSIFFKTLCPQFLLMLPLLFLNCESSTHFYHKSKYSEGKTKSAFFLKHRNGAVCSGQKAARSRGSRLASQQMRDPSFCASPPPLSLARPRAFLSLTVPFYRMGTAIQQPDRAPGRSKHRPSWHSLKTLRNSSRCELEVVRTGPEVLLAVTVVTDFCRDVLCSPRPSLLSLVHSGRAPLPRPRASLRCREIRSRRVQAAPGPTAPKPMPPATDSLLTQELFFPASCSASPPGD